MATISFQQFKSRISLWNVALAFIALLGVIAVLFPIYWMVITSIRPEVETWAFPPHWFPETITFEAYETLFADPIQRSYLVNTYIIALSTAVFSVALGSLAAYGFSRFSIPGASLLLAAILSLQMLPAVTLIIPFFNLSLSLGLHNTYLMLIMVDTAFALPISIWLLKSYLDSIPIDLEEAAMVDGCNRLQALVRVVLPLMLPGLVGTATFAFLFAWSEFIITVVLTSGPGVAPVTIAISRFFAQYGRDWNGVMALNVATSIPLLIVFIFLQRWVVQGMTAGAVK